jgi:hypothetical protein
VCFRFGSHLASRLLIATANGKYPPALIALVPKRSSADFVKRNQLTFLCQERQVLHFALPLKNQTLIGPKAQRTPKRGLRCTIFRAFSNLKSMESKN